MSLLFDPLAAIFYFGAQACLGTMVAVIKQALSYFKSQSKLDTVVISTTRNLLLQASKGIEVFRTVFFFFSPEATHTARQ